MSNGIFTTEPKNNQEAFNRVWQRFVLEGAPTSVKPGSASCLYRATPTHGCAIGVQLPDHLYVPELEGKGASYLIGTAEFASGEPVSEATLRGIRNHFRFIAPQLLRDLQAAHDSSHGVSDIAARLTNVAQGWNLTIPTGVAR